MAENRSHSVFNLIARNDLRGLRMVFNEHPDAIEMLDRYLNTPLLYACHLGHSRVVRYLLGVGANHGQLNIFGKYTRTIQFSVDNFSLLAFLLVCLFRKFKVKMH